MASSCCSLIQAEVRAQESMEDPKSQMCLHSFPVLIPTSLCDGVVLMSMACVLCVYRPGGPREASKNLLNLSPHK